MVISQECFLHFHTLPLFWEVDLCYYSCATNSTLISRTETPSDCEIIGLVNFVRTRWGDESIWDWLCTKKSKMNLTLQKEKLDLDWWLKFFPLSLQFARSLLLVSGVTSPLDWVTALTDRPEERRGALRHCLHSVSPSPDSPMSPILL